jgi:uncharacterized membrane protein
MSASIRPRAAWREWRVAAALVALSLVPSLAGGLRLAELARGATVTPANARFFAAPLPVVLHILAVVPFGIAGAFQFVPHVRRHHRAWHRRAGYALVVCGLVAALTGLWMTEFYPWPEGDGVAVYLMRLVVGAAMLASILASIAAIGRRDFDAHGAWMIRAYALGMGAGTQVLTHLPWFILVGKPAETPRAVLMGGAWLINVIVAEHVIRRGQRLGRVVPAGAIT